MLGYWIIMGVILIGSILGIIAYFRDEGRRGHGTQVPRSRPS